MLDDAAASSSHPSRPSESGLRRPLVRAALAGGVGILVVVGAAWWFQWPLPGSSERTRPEASPTSQVSSFSVGSPFSQDAWGHVQGAVLVAGQPVMAAPVRPDLSGMVLYLTGRDLTGQDLTGRHLTGQDLTGQDLTGQDLTGQDPGEPPDLALAAEDPATAQLAVLDQVEMTFIPHVVMVEAGRPLQLRNSDSAMHNVHASSQKNPPFNIGLQPGGMEELRLKRPEFIRVACNVHPRMSAWIAVLPNRWFTKVQRDGRFELDRVPPGRHQLAVWRESNYPPFTPRQVSLTIEVRAGCTTQVQLDFPE